MNDHVNILANRMRSATSAAQRKILMQQAEAMTFAAIATVLVTNQQYDASLPWSESVKPRMAKIPKRSFLEGREYSPRNQQELDLLLEVYGRGIRVTKSMQAQAMISMASDPLEAARERASKAVSLYDDADAALEKAAKEYQQAQKAAEDARVAASRELSQAMHTRDGSRPITSAEVNKLVSAADKRLKSFDDRVEKAEKAYQQARKDYDAAAAAKQKAQAEFVVANVQARSGKMQADVSMALSPEDAAQQRDVQKQVQMRRDLAKALNALKQQMQAIEVAMKNDDLAEVDTLVRRLGGFVDQIGRAADRLEY